MISIPLPFPRLHLTHHQIAAIPVIVASSTNAYAASNAGIDERTLYRWLETPGFRNGLTHISQKAAALGRKQIQGLVPDCLVTFAGTATQPTQTPATAVDEQTRAGPYLQ